MNSLKQQLLAVVAIAGLYVAVLPLLFPVQFTLLNVVSIGVVLVIFTLSALITSAKEAEDQKANAQKFILATTVQMLIALFYVLFTKVLSPDHFKGMSIHFLIVFFLMLAAQAILLVKKVRAK